MPPTYSLVVPIFNEEAVIPILLRRLDALLEFARRAGRGDRRRRRIAGYKRDRDRGQGSRRPALPARQAVAQFRSSGRDHRRTRSRRRPRGHRHGRRSAGSAGNRPYDDRKMEGGLRRHRRGAHVAGRRKPLQADDRRSLLSPHRRALGNADTPQRRRLPPDRPQGARTLSAPCPSATGSCAACSPGSGSDMEP